MDKHHFEFDEKPAEVTRKSDPDSKLKENHDNSAFRVFLVFITWLLLLISRDGNGFFIAMAVLCVPLLRDYYMDMRSFHSDIQSPLKKHIYFKFYRYFTFAIVTLTSVVPLAGLLGIIGVGFDCNGNAYAYIVDNIFFNAEFATSLSVFLFGTLLLPIFTLIDWIYTYRVNQAK